LIFGNANQAGTDGWEFGLDANSNLRFRGEQTNAGGSYKTSTSASALSVGVWTHVAAVATFDDNTGPGLVDFTDVQLYVNYLPTGTAARFFGATITETSGVMGPVLDAGVGDYRIGSTPGILHTAFDGLIDELRISSGALAPADFLTASGVSPPRPVSSMPQTRFMPVISIQPIRPPSCKQLSTPVKMFLCRKWWRATGLPTNSF